MILLAPALLRAPFALLKPQPSPCTPAPAQPRFSYWWIKPNLLVQMDLLLAVSQRRQCSALGVGAGFSVISPFCQCVLHLMIRSWWLILHVFNVSLCFYPPQRGYSGGGLAYRQTHVSLSVMWRAACPVVMELGMNICYWECQRGMCGGGCLSAHLSIYRSLAWRKCLKVTLV